jgi:hypothetical protein
MTAHNSKNNNSLFNMHTSKDSKQQTADNTQHSSSKQTEQCSDSGYSRQNSRQQIHTKTFKRNKKRKLEAGNT